MRGLWLIGVGIYALGCKGEESHKPAPAAAAPAKASTARPQPPPPAPKLDLDQEFQSETEDKAWADATEKSIRAVAPELGDVTCLQRQCRAILTAASQDELVAKAEALQADASLRSIDAKNVLLSAADPQGGKLAMKIYVRFDR